MLGLNNLFARLKDLEITPKKLSNDTGISTGNISDWKSGRSMPTATKLIILADYLNCSIDYLLGRTNVVELNMGNLQESNFKVVHTSPKSISKTVIKPLFLTPVSAGTGSWLDDDTPAEWITVPKTDETVSADFLIKVSGDSMQPKYYDGDIVMVKKSNSITEGEFGVFILNSEAYIKKMGKGELISLNPDYDNIAVSEYDTISCAGKVIGVLENE